MGWVGFGAVRLESVGRVELRRGGRVREDEEGQRCWRAWYVGGGNECQVVEGDVDPGSGSRRGGVISPFSPCRPSR